MISSLRYREPKPYHPNDKQNIRKRRKMEARLKNRKNPNEHVLHVHMFKSFYSPPTDSACYNRWVWLFRP